MVSVAMHEVIRFTGLGVVTLAAVALAIGGCKKEEESDVAIPLPAEAAPTVAAEGTAAGVAPMTTEPAAPGAAATPAATTPAGTSPAATTTAPTATTTTTADAGAGKPASSGAGGWKLPSGLPPLPSTLPSTLPPMPWPTASK
jgi:hypothetical protein